MANTSIRIKRSLTTGVPASGLSGELSYSYLSNTLFIGTPDGNGVVNVGGQYYTSQIDNATDSAVALTLVRRDATGNASFNYITANIIGMIDGVAAKATRLETARDFSISGGDITASAVSFDGTGNVTLNASLDAVSGLSAGTYGNTSSIPVVGVSANGRVTSISTVSISTDLSISGDSGTDTVHLATDTLNFAGGAGITSAVTDNVVTFDVDNTVVRANTASLNQTIDGNISISGNLTVLGTQTTVNTQTLNIADPLLYLASNNYSSDIVDIGFVGNYYDGTQRHTGFIRHAGTQEFFIFDHYEPEPDSNVIDIANSSFRTANVNAGYFKGNVIGSTARFDSVILDTVLGVASGGTGQSTFSAGQVLIGDGTSGLKQLANVSSVNTTLANNETVTNLTTDVYGRVTGFTKQSIGSLTVSQGGTGQTTFTGGAILVGNGTGGLQTLANTTYTATGSGAQNNTITSVTVDAYGRLTAATFQQISGLTVGQGGTGVSSFTTNGITYGNGSGAMQVTAAAGTSDQTFSNQILTVTNAGVPVWSTTLDGGQF
jgi:hypothetical protein